MTRDIQIDLDRFTLDKLQDDTTILILGQRSGKSAVLWNLIYHWHMARPTRQITVYNHLSERGIKELMAHQRSEIVENPEADNRCLLVIDNMDTDKVSYSEVFKQLILNGRHLKITILLVAQPVYDLTPDIRSQVDYVFTLKENIRANREKLYKYFYGIFPNFDMFNKVMTACTQNDECLVMDNTARDVTVFYYQWPSTRSDTRYLVLSPNADGT